MSIHLTEEQALLQRTVRDFANREIAPQAERLDEAEEFPAELLEKIRGLGLLGIGIDPGYGGSGGGSMEGVIAMEEISRAYAGLGTVFALQIGLWGQLIQRFASERQKRDYLRPLTGGNLVAAYALTEPNTGSDAAAIETSAVRRGDTYILNGQKTFISCGDKATHFLVVATMDRKLRDKGITCFIVHGDSRGLSTRKQTGKIGIRASTTAEVFIQDVEVPAANRVGEEGSGFKIVMQVLESSRIQVGAQAVGIAQCALDASVAWANQRKTFGVPISQHQGIQFMLADMATRVEAARLLTYQAAKLRDAGQPFSKEGAMAKLFAAEAAMWVATKAVQIHGGYGYFKGSVVERCFRDAKITEIYEGTSEVQRMVIARRMLHGNR